VAGLQSDRAPRGFLTSAALAACALILGPSPCAASEPVRELTLPDQVDFVRAMLVGETLHVVYAKDKRCFYRRGTPAALGEPLPVDREGPEVIAGGERGPWLHATEDALLVMWQVRGGLHLVRSNDRGQTWARVRVSDRAEGVDMPALIGGPQNRVYVVWVDGRDGKRAGDNVASELYMASSTDGGQTFGQDVKLTERAPGVCPCCQPALAIDADGKLWISYRSSERNRKEIQLLRVDRGRVTAAQVSNDQWEFNGCPMAGPSLAIAGQGKSLAAVVAWRKDQDVQSASTLRGPSRFGAPERLGRGRYYATAVDGEGHLLLLWDEGRQTGYRELWEEGRSGRLDQAPAGFLLGLPGGGFLRIRGREEAR